ncbi:hypothetical protein ACNQQN_25045 [Mycobacteroides chelonae]|uniref:hypothetical protein n=1 Tax=Mycobacteroides TaxID=670516 RepID=UPI00092946E9|nr:hypothetical protein [Mycobacteroides abscessus]SKO51536.1 Uncharacterised protein [Mycobacteroides abscessus subsp. bolletii]MDM2382264.1 hypothetical protein [Mycobacteroides abscessus]MDM2388120.1 hypothetical protein [Mycobacteroides abscessus]SIN11182.1 Uncharacterised protein [Mycobacteroides abscessus subsp. abscessus]SIN12245.1 Uncharacterised protein [Mycobacteroides abscessus subsp. abscessus]
MAEVSEAQKVIVGVLDSHIEDGLTNYDTGRNECGCCTQRPDETYREHVAAEIDKVLGELTRQWGVVIDYPPRPEDGYPGAVVVLDSYRMREAAELVKRTKYPEDDYEVRPRWVSGWTEVAE